MTAELSAVTARVTASGRITEADVREIRGVVYPDMTLDPREADALFALDEAATDRDPAWTDLFCEAMTDLLVRQAEPQGYVDDEAAAWFMERISQDGEVRSDTELEAVVRVLEQAERAPEALSAFALDQVRRAVVEGTGPLPRKNAGGGALTPGRVGEAEAELVRRILYAFGGDGAVAVTKSEAEVLFDINDAVEGADNHPAWTDLFVKALANFLMAASGYEAPSRREALRREEWLESETGGVGDFMARMAKTGFSGLIRQYRAPSLREAWADRNEVMDARQEEAEAVTSDEAEWLARRMRRDGEFGEAERALLKFIGEESPDIHPALKPLIDAA
ncbi:hypothetical protein DDZ18_12195 [Marinicauda salina]|uniref:Uncharacterized protein n=1 Tax=Marinicauda salina TaxID=2135793 RepID=A0A2U2BR90_9PROT|nr:hypothetical protein [Marinicauda salina]PWE16523.1 hypothetical protein DDZ18_12195 [Marinicauda salina]